jgi:hypothetical protein
MFYFRFCRQGVKGEAAADFRDACLGRIVWGESSKLQAETPRCSISPSFYFQIKRGILRLRHRHNDARRPSVEHMDHRVCDLEFRLLCFMSGISLAVSGTVIFFLV